MYDTAKILSGLLLFVLVLSFPLWWNLATVSAVSAPNIELPAGEDSCVLPRGEMRASHMEVLNQWRDLVVRNQERVMTVPDGRRYVRSLTRGCLGCHTDKSTFCDRCHQYAAVTPYCWDCHVVPEGGGS